MSDYEEDEDEVPECYGTDWSPECELDCPYSDDCMVECHSDPDPIQIGEGPYGEPILDDPRKWRS